MNKLYYILVFIFPSLVQAQDTIQFEERVPMEFKADSKEKTLEVQLEPFGNNPISINGIRARWFSSPQRAFRLNAFIGMNSDTEITQQALEVASLKELKKKSNIYSVNIRPGFERHLKGTKRLSPYFGTELDLAYQYSSTKDEFQVDMDVNYTRKINENGYYRIGLNFIAGFDLYVAKKLYLGTEFGYGASFTKLQDVKIKSNREGFVAPEPQKRGSSFDVGTNVNAQIRLGYAF